MSGAHALMLKQQEEADSLSPRTRGTKLQKLDPETKLLDAENAKYNRPAARFVPTDSQKWETGGVGRRGLPVEARLGRGWGGHGRVVLGVPEVA